ncbi:MAG: bifunctional adenosylcobinamide kinase/adenosylcobinamide-phosphate guanylyltransferase, partial [Bacteroidales bacterium]|nr:bifunctional adenosylcobinamide kinase/adenosylcobinamide-phosphate guanylyltransferase [Bacteroidales bacterium]
TVLLDCVTLWLTNIFQDNKYDLESSLTYAKNEWQEFTSNDFNLIVITNELGMGIHAEHASSRKFTDLQGWMNQYIASRADKVIFMVSGIPLQIKHEEQYGESAKT